MFDLYRLFSAGEFSNSELRWSRLYTIPLMIHAHDWVIFPYNCLIFKHLFGQTVGAGPGDASTPKSIIISFPRTDTICLKHALEYLQKPNMLAFPRRISFHTTESLL